ncbi:MAG: hypothetical protein LBC80_05685 [Treponema sp.]|jgi:hypothetical protein|nr:hypothetical protein [Treponema sp.]
MRTALKQFSSLFSILFVVSCTSIPVHIVPDGRQIPADFTGIAHAGRTGTDTEFQQLSCLNPSWTLYTFAWNRIEAMQGEWDFSFYDKITDDCVAAGIKIIGILAYDAGWIHEENRRLRYVPPHRLPDFLLYVKKTVEHFRGRVDAWCIWNEPNFHFWTGPQDEFIELSRQTADVVREVDSDVILLAGAFNRMPRGLPVGFIKELFESGAMEKVDYIAFHPYEANVKRSIRLYEQFRKVVDEYGFGDKIWITEMGFPTGGWYPSRISLKRLPEAVIKIYTHLAYAGAMNVLWYQLYDPEIRERRGIRKSEDYFGLIRSVSDPTSKGANAFRLCAFYMPDTICYVLTSEQDGIPRSIQAFSFRGEKDSALVLWKDGIGKKRINIRLPGTNHLRHNIVTGNEVTVPAEINIRVGREPVFFTWQNSID